MSDMQGVAKCKGAFTHDSENIKIRLSVSRNQKFKPCSQESNQEIRFKDSGNFQP